MSKYKVGILGLRMGHGWDEGAYMHPKTELSLVFDLNLEASAGTQIADACIELSKHGKKEIFSDPYADRSPTAEIWSYGAFRPELE